MLRPTRLDPLFAPIDALKGVGPSTARLFARLLEAPPLGGPPRVLDLVLHAPTGAIDRRARVSVAEAQADTVVTVTVTVDDHRPAPPGRPSAPYRIVTSDGTSDLVLVFFGGDRSFLARLLPVGATRVVSGKVEVYDGIKQMVHPDHVLDPAAAASLPAVEATYPLTEGLNQRTVAKAMAQALHRVPALPEWIDPQERAKRGWPTFADAVRTLHAPQSPMDIAPMAPALARLAYDELLAGQLAFALHRGRTARAPARPLTGDGAIIAAVRAALPYALTGAQERSVGEIHADLASGHRMLRLLQGDVGSGKTVVALLTMARAAEAGRQSALMAPTEILARQHFKTIAPLAAAAGLNAGILTGREKGKEREATLAAAADGSLHILVGTHALFQDAVRFHDLGLAVVDEQHRFGVQQRLALAAKGDGVHLLVTTATPIPRTLVLTYYGDMDISRLDEKPPGRQPIDTRVVPLERLGEIVEGLGRAIAAGHRVYWICPLVEESETLDQAAVEARHGDLVRVFGSRVGLLHGRMKGPDKDAAIAAFARGDTDILVATTVVEVGVDVPEASIIVIESAERFGLAQLHQLRGRVGRGTARSTCVLVYGSGASQTALERLSVIRDTDDGFVIAEADLKLRGQGEVLGTRQSGLPATKLVNWEAHADLVPPARDDARLLVARDPDLTSPRGEAARLLLHLFDKADALRLVEAG